MRDVALLLSGGREIATAGSVLDRAGWPASLSIFDVTRILREPPRRLKAIESRMPMDSSPQELPNGWFELVFRFLLAKPSIAPRGSPPMRTSTA